MTRRIITEVAKHLADGEAEKYLSGEHRFNGGADAGEAAAACDFAVVLATAARRGDRDGERGAGVPERGAGHVHALVREDARGSHASVAAPSRCAMLCYRSTIALWIYSARFYSYIGESMYRTLTVP